MQSIPQTQPQYPVLNIENYQNVYESWRRFHFLNEDYMRYKIRRKIAQQQLLSALHHYNQSLVGEIMHLSQWIEEANKGHRDEVTGWNEITKLVRVNQLTTEYIKHLTRIQEIDLLTPSSS